MTDSDLRSPVGLESIRLSLTPMFRFQQDSLSALDRLTRYQLAVAGDHWAWRMAQTSAVLSAKSPAELIAGQFELGAKFGDQLCQRATELTSVVAEAAKSLQPLIQKGVSEPPVVALGTPVAVAPASAAQAAVKPSESVTPITPPSTPRAIVPVSAAPAAVKLSESVAPAAPSSPPVAVAPVNAAPAAVKPSEPVAPAAPPSASAGSVAPTTAKVQTLVANPSRSTPAPTDRGTKNPNGRPVSAPRASPSPAKPKRSSKSD
jgi:hypothetical protein